MNKPVLARWCAALALCVGEGGVWVWVADFGRKREIERGRLGLEVREGADGGDEGEGGGRGEGVVEV